jgi:RHS repeat-associated protein
VRGLTDESGALSGAASYDAFGSVTSQSGATSSFGYTGEQHDPTGTIHLRARAYDPDSGRFLSADTVQPNAPGTQGYNRYAYVANNPTTWTDPTGHMAGAAAGAFALSEYWLPIAIAFGWQPLLRRVRWSRPSARRCWEASRSS